MFRFDGEYQAVHSKVKFWSSVKYRKKSAVKYSKEKQIFHTFVNLSPTFCPRFSEDTDFYF